MKYVGGPKDGREGPYQGGVVKVVKPTIPLRVGRRVKEISNDKVAVTHGKYEDHNGVYVWMGWGE